MPDGSALAAGVVRDADYRQGALPGHRPLWSGSSRCR